MPASPTRVRHDHWDPCAARVQFCIGDARHGPAQHAIDDAILQGERIIRGTIETVAPEMAVGVEIDQPGDDARAVIDPPQAAHQGIVGAAIALPPRTE